MTETLERLKAALADRYTLERELGSGGMATVYLARDHKHDRPVALKVMHPELAASLGPKRFLQEIRTTARLQHPHILTVLDSAEAEGLLWYTMPYVRGESLRERLRREVQLSVESALELARQVALALDHAHREGVVHRDLKPENILLSDDQALVADFGVAKALAGATEGEGRLTETGLAVGTPAYMSPEQASGGLVDARSDIYALGCVLYEMLTGEPPFTGRTPQAVLAKRVLEPVPHVRTLRESVPEVIERALVKALARAPADRFPTAAEFARALDIDRPIEAVTVAESLAPLVRSVGSPRRVPRRGMVLALFGVLAIGSASAGLLWRSRTAPPELDADLLAVAPFDVLDPKLQLWHEGLADLLARSLDGAGPLRTVSPTAVIRRWRGRAERESAERLAASTGAGAVVYGALLPTGPDSVRLTANVLEAIQGKVVGEVELRGSADRVEQLTDSLAVRVLRELGRTRPSSTMRWAALSSRSLPALRVFLRGEQALRRSDWEAAQASYEEAVALDSTFALAHWRLGTALGWQDGDHSAGTHYARAGALNRGLPPRESLLIVSDSLRVTLVGGLRPGSLPGAALERLFGTTSLLTTRYRTDPEAWVALGDAAYHYGPGVGVGDDMALRAFGRAIALDSSYAPAYIHAVELALNVGDEAAARHYAARILALGPGTAAARKVGVTFRLLDPGASAAALHLLADTLPTEALFSVWGNFALAPDSAERGNQLVRELATRHITEEVWYREPAVRQGLLGVALAYRGHLRECLAIVRAHEEELAGWGLYTELALGGVIPAEAADRFFSQRLGREPFWPASVLRFAPPWWAARGDTSSLKRYIRRLDSRADRGHQPTLRAPDRYWLAPMTNPYWRASAQAYLALARRDTAGALRGLAALPDSVGTVWFERLTLARLLAARGSDREALAVLDREFPYPYPIGSRAYWGLERARLAERLGETEKARYWYGYVARVWRHADTELQPLVAEAREALGRLTGESSR